MSKPLLTSRELLTRPLGSMVSIDPESLPLGTNPSFEFHYFDISCAANGRLQIPATSITYAEAPSRARRIVRNGDVLMSTVRPSLKAFAYCNMPEGSYVASTGFAVLRAVEGNDPRYILYSILSDDVARQIESYVVGSNYPAINSSDVKRLQIPDWKPPQQRRIAEILSTVDEAIEQTESLIAKYQQIKAGLMQDLFTRGVTPDGHLRPTRAQAPYLYKESPLGWIPKEWEVFAIAQLGRLGRGRVISQDYLEMHPGEYPVYSSQSIDEGVFGKIDSYDFEGEYVTWTTDGAFAGTVFYRCGRFNCTNVCGTIHPFVFVDAKFLAGVLSGKTSRHVSYVGNPKLMNNVMAKIQVPIPKNIAEQKTIAHRIEAAGLVLKSHAEDRQKLRHQKQGLMQDLLTGRVRVKVGEAEEKR